MRHQPDADRAGRPVGILAAVLALLVAYDLVGRWNRQRKLIQEGWVTDVAGIILTVNLFCFGLLIFSGHLFE